MGKRSNFERKELDFYPTPIAAVIPLIPHLAGESFCEPCAGAGDLINHLHHYGMKCVSAFDVNPLGDGIYQHDVSLITETDMKGASIIITNPPWERSILHQTIERCSILRPTWLLFDADWAHTKQSAPYMKTCSKIISIGRIKWIEGSKSVGMDNCCWYLFDSKTKDNVTAFYGRL